MYEKFLLLKKNKPWIFYLLIIPFVVIWCLNLYSKYLVNSGKQIVKDAEKEDEQLKKQQDKAEAGADYHKEEADKAEEKIKNTTPNEDWHLDD